MRIIEVATAVIVDPDTGRCLYGLRPDDGDRPGLWEHPGGKLEPGESHAGAVVREAREELGDEISLAVPGWAGAGLGDLTTMIAGAGAIGTASVDLVTHVIVLSMFGLLLVEGTPRPLVHKALRWSDPQYAVDRMPCSPMTYPLHRALCTWLAAQRIRRAGGWVDL